jgi:23S rRNA pseudouridine2605 synthase
MEQQMLLKALTRAGIASRRKLAEAIQAQRVTVNGQVTTAFNQPLDPAKDEIRLDGKLVTIQPHQYVYLVLNKPKGVLSTVRDERCRKTIIDLLPQKYRQLRLYPVGRLDRDSTGLILLTNDGDLAHRLTHPSYEHEKEYHVRIDGELASGDIKRLKEGIQLEDGPTAAARVEKLGGSRYGITIHEGRKRQVRRMFEALGHPVLELKRVRLGDLKLGDLKEGGVREVESIELGVILKHF